MYNAARVHSQLMTRKNVQRRSRTQLMTRKSVQRCSRTQLMTRKSLFLTNLIQEATYSYMILKWCSFYSSYFKFTLTLKFFFFIIQLDLVSSVPRTRPAPRQKNSSAVANDSLALQLFASSKRHLACFRGTK